jgi:hypothetical protein
LGRSKKLSAIRKRQWRIANPEWERTYRRAWLAKNRDKNRLYQRKYMLAAKEWLRRQKDRPCKDCGVRYPAYIMDFHHVRGRKLFGISAGIRRSPRAVIREIKKCDLICANCHRERTWGQ